MGGADSNDFFRFTLSQRSSNNFSLARLKADANLQLLNDKGQVLFASARRDRSSESIKTTLDSGTYYLRVYSSAGRNPSSTHYQLCASVSASPVSPWDFTPMPHPDNFANSYICTFPPPGHVEVESSSTLPLDTIAPTPV
ncbi:PPC domain-containing protein [Cyanobacteria bacterium FACHB-502]|nr:PPC domain-containing protein [Cyanobacteria bacterium FACHB-502]MBD2024806.1 PPC domain-containing protein [Leptolyngbya sp. FACHB-711]